LQTCRTPVDAGQLHAMHAQVRLPAPAQLSYLHSWRPPFDALTLHLLLDCRAVTSFTFLHEHDRPQRSSSSDGPLRMSSARCSTAHSTCCCSPFADHSVAQGASTSTWFLNSLLGTAHACRRRAAEPVLRAGQHAGAVTPAHPLQLRMMTASRTSCRICICIKALEAVLACSTQPSPSTTRTHTGCGCSWRPRTGCWAPTHHHTRCTAA
jgi:hypothetical protein